MMGKNHKHFFSLRDVQVMKHAEDTLDSKVGRVNEIINYAEEAGLKRIGIANCISFEKEALALEKILEQNGFIITRANCKLGKLPFSDIVPGYKGTACNPAGQANLMNENSTELNLVLGLCVGHDMIFNAKSAAYTSTLLVKDRKYNHNTFEQLTLYKEVNSASSEPFKNELPD